jgi:phosphoserine phosphatase
LHTITLITNPADPRLDTATVEELRDRWGGAPVRWLAPGTAAEFDVADRPRDLWEAWGELQARGIDLAAQPAAGRAKKMLLADMDSTMIAQECIDELADMAGVGAEVAAITTRAMNGELDFEGALRARIGLLRDLDAGVIVRVLAERITDAPGARTLVATMRARGGYAALVSGGFTAFTEPVAARLGFDEHRANTLDVDGGRLTGEAVEPILGREAKVAALADITARLGIAEADVIAVGDGANDLGMLERAGTGVAMHAKPSVAAVCDIRINHGDLTALLHIQGIPQAEFVN